MKLLATGSQLLTQYWSELMISPPLRVPSAWKTPRWTPVVLAGKKLPLPGVQLPHEPLYVGPQPPPKMLAVG